MARREIPRAAVDYLTEQVNRAVAAAQERAAKVLDRIDWSDVAAGRELAIEACAIALEAYAPVAARASADFYDAARELVVGEPLGARAESGYDRAATEGAIRAGVQRIVEGKAAASMTEFAMQRIDYELKRAAGFAVAANAAADPAGAQYARVPTGAETCTFCLMLASRGFVYHSADLAGEKTHYHPHCDCRIVPSWDASSVEGYDPDEVYRRWKTAEKIEAAKGLPYSCRMELKAACLRKEEDIGPNGEDYAGIRKRLESIETQTGLLFSKGSTSEELSIDLGLRDPEWLLRGSSVSIGYADEAVKAFKAADKHHAREAESASVFASLGYRAIFVQDEKTVPNQNGKGTITIGYPDLSTGVEIKTLDNATTENTIKSHISSAKKKPGFVIVAMDFSGNPHLNDEEVEALVSSALGRKHVSSAIVAFPSGDVRYVRRKK